MTKTWVLMQGRSSAGMVIAATLLLSMAANKTHGSVQDTPVSLTSSSWNADVVYGAAVSGPDSATAFDGHYAWDGADALVSGADYLPSSVTLPTYINPTTGYYDSSHVVDFSSAVTNSITATNTEFEFQPFTLDNVNLFSGGSTGGTLTLTAATAFDNIAILAASAGSGQHYVSVDITLHFADGSTSSLVPYNIYDWGKYSGGAGALPNAVDRSTASSTLTPETSSQLDYNNSADFQMYETDFNLAGFGYSNKAITSVSFSAPSSGDVGIFALSGYANPTQPLPVQPTAPDPAVTLPGSLPLTFSGGTLLALAAIGRRFARLRWPMIR